MRGGGIKERLLLLALLPGALIALVLFSYFTYGQLTLATDALHNRGLTIVKQLGPASEYGFITGNIELLDKLSATLLHQPDLNGLTISDTKGRIVFTAGTVSGLHSLPDLQEDARQCAEYENALLFCAPIIKTVVQVSDFDMPTQQRDEVIGAVYVEVSTTALQSQHLAIIARAVAITGVLLLLTGVFAVRVSNSISRPLKQATDTVSKVAAGEMDLNVGVSAQGEIGQLINGIDKMIISLRQARDEMQENIDQATRQLRYAMGALEEKNIDLDKQRLRAQAASEAKSRFLANMSHEIRTPLSGMVGLLFLLRHTKPTIEQQEYLDNLESSASTLRTLIDDILDLSRIEAGRLVIHEQEFLLRNLASGVAVMLAPAAHQKDVEFIVHVERDVPHWVSGDPLRLRQVLTNLLGNAVKFTERGFVRLRISLVPEVSAGARQVRFAVEDSGIGIAAEKLDYIFESFAQADESTTRRYGGSGLGTTISRELVTLMGGRLQVSSEIGRGTSFAFELPMVTGDEDAHTANPLGAGQILLLEENAQAGEAEQHCLEAQGFVVTWVTTSEELERLYAQQREAYRLVLLAENSRSCKWPEVAQRLRAVTGEDGNASIGALTFYDSKCDLSSYDMAMHKPLDGELLARRWLERSDQLGAKLAEEGAAAAGEAQPLSILLAEDDAINAKVMTFFLQQKGHAVEVASNGSEALQLLRGRHFDLAFLDMRMPEMDGLMVARQWRREEGRDSHLPLIAVTANVTREDRMACLEAGMDDFVSKPVDSVRLAELLERYALKQRTAKRANN